MYIQIKLCSRVDRPAIKTKDNGVITFVKKAKFRVSTLSIFLHIDLLNKTISKELLTCDCVLLWFLKGTVAAASVGEILIGISVHVFIWF